MQYQVSVKITGDKDFFEEVNKRLKYYFKTDLDTMTIKGRLEDHQLPTFWGLLWLDSDNVKVGKINVIAKADVADWDNTTVRCLIKPVIKAATGSVQLCLLPEINSVKEAGKFWAKTMLNIEIQKLTRLIWDHGSDWYWDWENQNAAF